MVVPKKTVSKVKPRAGFITRRKKNNPVRPGMQFGDLHINKRVATKQGASGGQKWDCTCSCGNRLTIPQWYLMRKEHPKTHCGCKVKEASANLFQRERGIFYMMHRRCYNDTHVAYKHYGGATPPIGVCNPWNKDVVGNEVAFANFIADMKAAPSRKYTLDRIDPWKGYGWQQKDNSDELYLNCRWATASEQMNNLKKHWPHPDERQKIETFAYEVAGGDDDDGDEDEVDSGTEGADDESGTE
jgi:hypothetical protein